MSPEFWASTTGIHSQPSNLFFKCWNRASLSCPAWSWTHSVAQSSNAPAPASQVAKIYRPQPPGPATDLSTLSLVAYIWCSISNCLAKASHMQWGGCYHLIIQDGYWDAKIPLRYPQWWSFTFWTRPLSDHPCICMGRDPCWAFSYRDPCGWRQDPSCLQPGFSSPEWYHTPPGYRELMASHTCGEWEPQWGKCITCGFKKPHDCHQENN